LAKIGEVLTGIYVFDADEAGAGEVTESPGQELLLQISPAWAPDQSAAELGCVQVWAMPMWGGPGRALLPQGRAVALRVEPPAALASRP
jgi:hypothetical protein